MRHDIELEIHHKQLRSPSGYDSEKNLITLCTLCMLASIAEELGVAAGCPLSRSISVVEPQTLNPPTLLVLVQTFEIVFSQYDRHPEYGSLAPGDTACKADSAGLLNRHPVTASAFHFDRQGDRAGLGAG